MRTTRPDLSDDQKISLLSCADVITKESIRSAIMGPKSHKAQWDYLDNLCPSKATYVMDVFKNYVEMTKLSHIDSAFVDFANMYAAMTHEVEEIVDKDDAKK